jgi:hypothetical protein
VDGDVYAVAKIDQIEPAGRIRPQSKLSPASRIVPRGVTGYTDPI